MPIKHKTIRIGVIIAIFFGGFLLIKEPIEKLYLSYTYQKNNQDFKTINIKGEKFGVFVADTQEKRVKGLSGKEDIADNEGMLFIFDKPALHQIWMKDMNFPIDIIWLNENKSVIHIEKNVSPSTYPELFAPYEPALYVLELKAGTIDKVLLNIGEKVEF